MTYLEVLTLHRAEFDKVCYMHPQEARYVAKLRSMMQLSRAVLIDYRSKYGVSREYHRHAATPLDGGRKSLLTPLVQQMSVEEAMEKVPEQLKTRGKTRASEASTESAGDSDAGSPAGSPNVKIDYDDPGRTTSMPIMKHHMKHHVATDGESRRREEEVKYEPDAYDIYRGSVYVKPARQKTAEEKRLDASKYFDNYAARIASSNVPLEEKQAILARLITKLFEHNVELEDKIDTMLRTSEQNALHD
jgi:hypothetical protein